MHDLRQATTQIYADYAPGPTNGAIWAERAFGPRADTASSAAVACDATARE